MTAESPYLTRRRLLVAASSLALLSGCTPDKPSGAVPGQAAYTIAELLDRRPYYIAHRGSGDNWPEHTGLAYAQAVAAGSMAIEVSVNATSDGVLVCHHDSDTARLTGSNLVIADTPYSVLAGLRNDARAWLGPASPREPIALLKDVLDAYAASHVIFIEDKQGSNARALLDLMDSYPDSRSHFVWKQEATAGRVAMASGRGYRTWGYFGDDLYDRIDELEPRFDYLGVHHTASDEVIRTMVSTGKPVICWAVHTRSMRDRLLRLGVSGMMCSNIPYVASADARYQSDQFGTGLRAAGDLPWEVDGSWSRQPLIQPGPASLALAGPGSSSYCMGSMCPLPKNIYGIQFQMRWPENLPGDREHAGLAFGQAGDQPYRVFQLSEVGGYHLVIRASGELELFSRDPGQVNGKRLGTMQTDKPRPGEWMSFRVDVTPINIGYGRTDGTRWRDTVRNDAFRGGYFSLTKNYDGEVPVEFRKISTV
ncbi:glycerophosphodiester phosphodiesterase [Arthrobacter sp. I2-34]|uniref:Glycerophosphodiester phosphodiesterase n=1 Tax=Arthrobacter hankyongi TaxID=2904801 RepID=A0ABS9L1L3_9MICC|nr:glycerophosphodiester phosphodiesterase [Arthrobacter hankyongi]MCG2620537.1 glycerophosphodiester phosphodiesterase [Arthrobacter hankyongi]